MAETVTMPKLGFDMAEGTLIRWVIGEGEAVKRGAVLAEIETDKATVEVESAYEGILARHLVPQGSVVPVNTPIAIIAQPGEPLEGIGEPAKTAGRGEEVQPAREEDKVQPASAALPNVFTPPAAIKASPLARRIAAEKGIPLQGMSGSGPGGRIVKRDVEAFAAQQSPAVSPPPPAVSPQPPAGGGQPLNRLRAAIGRRMVEAKQSVPHFYVTHDYDVAALLDLRQQINAWLPENEKLSLNDFIVKAVALTLEQFPNLNASLQGEQIVTHTAINVGVAVAVEGGLLTVVCREANRKSLRQIAAEVKSLASRARQGKVRPEDIEGSTFSISNLGMYAVEHFIAIINPPEAAILAVGSARQTPVVSNDAIVPGWRMKATLSVDHRISDGAEAARFLQVLGDYLETPLKMLA